MKNTKHWKRAIQNEIKGAMMSQKNTILRHPSLPIVASLMLISALFAACTPNAQPPLATPTELAVETSEYAGKKVLWVDSYHEGYEWSDGVQGRIQTVLEGAGVELKIIHMDTKRNTDEPFCEAAGKQALQEIEAFQPDVVIATDDNAQKCLVVPYLMGSDLPVVFAGVNWNADAYGYPAENITGMIEVELVEQTIALVEPYAKGTRIAYVTIDSETERKIADTYNQRFFDGQMKTYWALTQQEFKDAFLAAQQETDILFISNNAGAPDWDEEAMKKFMLSNTTIPTVSINPWMAPYVLADLGKLPEEQGEWAAGAALKILDGTPVSDILIEQNKKGRLILNLDLADKLGIVFPPSVLKNAETTE
jgi:hypothetical protein